MTDSWNRARFECNQRWENLVLIKLKEHVTSLGAASPPRAMKSNTSVAVIASDSESLREQSIISPKKLPARKNDALQIRPII